MDFVSKILHPPQGVDDARPHGTSIRSRAQARFREAENRFEEGKNNLYRRTEEEKERASRHAEELRYRAEQKAHKDFDRAKGAAWSAKEKLKQTEYAVPRAVNWFGRRCREEAKEVEGLAAKIARSLSCATENVLNYVRPQWYYSELDPVETVAHRWWESMRPHMPNSLDSSDRYQEIKSDIAHSQAGRTAGRIYDDVVEKVPEQARSIWSRLFFEDKSAPRRSWEHAQEYIRNPSDGSLYKYVPALGGHHERLENGAYYVPSRLINASGQGVGGVTAVPFSSLGIPLMAIVIVASVRKMWRIKHKRASPLVVHLPTQRVTGKRQVELSESKSSDEEEEANLLRSLFNFNETRDSSFKKALILSPISALLLILMELDGFSRYFLSFLYTTGIAALVIPCSDRFAQSERALNLAPRISLFVVVLAATSLLLYSIFGHTLDCCGERLL